MIKLRLKKLLKKAQNVTPTYNTVANKRLMLQKAINLMIYYTQWWNKHFNLFFISYFMSALSLLTLIFNMLAGCTLQLWHIIGLPWHSPVKEMMCQFVGIPKWNYSFTYWLNRYSWYAFTVLLALFPLVSSTFSAPPAEWMHSTRTFGSFVSLSADWFLFNYNFILDLN